MAALKYYHLLIVIIATGGGILIGYDACANYLVYLMDSFNIYFGLGTWNGEYHNSDGLSAKVLYEIKKYDNEFGNTALSYSEIRNEYYLYENIPDLFYVYRTVVKTENESLIEGSTVLSYIISAICGAFIASFIGEKYGRKRSITIGSIVYSIGCLVNALAIRSIIFLIVSRILVGLAIGNLSVICPVYLAEILPAKDRGKYSYCFYGMMLFGMFISGVINLLLYNGYNVFSYKETLNVHREDVSESINNSDWRVSFGIQACIGIIYSALSTVIPRSPSWLCFNERNVEAHQVIAKFRDANTDDIQVEEKFEDLQNEAIYNRAIGQSSYTELFSSSVRRQTINTICMHMFHQWSGVNIYKYYYRYFNPSFMLSTLGGLVLIFIFLAVIPGIFIMSIIDKFGRKRLLAVCTGILGFFNFINILIFPYDSHPEKYLSANDMFEIDKKCYKENIQSVLDKDNLIINKCLISRNNINKSNINYDFNIKHTLQFFAIYLILIISVSCWGAIPWIYQSEVFPLRIRTKGSAIGTFSYFINYGLTIFFSPILFDNLLFFLFVIFTVNCGIALISSVLFCRETKDIPLEEMESKLSGKTE